MSALRASEIRRRLEPRARARTAAIDVAAVRGQARIAADLARHRDLDRGAGQRTPAQRQARALERVAVARIAGRERARIQVAVQGDVPIVIDHQRLKHLHGDFSAEGVRRLVMDEFALHKGHRYATVALDAERMRVLWVGAGNSREAIRPFFELLGEQGCQRIEAVAMDMNTAMDLEVRQQCPNAEVVYDLFHVVARFGREVVDRVRVDQANTLRAEPKARQVIKRSRWLLLRNRDNLKAEQAVKLKELLAANQPLATVYLLKTELKEIWYAPSVR